MGQSLSQCSPPTKPVPAPFAADGVPATKSIPCYWRSIKQDPSADALCITDPAAAPSANGTQGLARASDLLPDQNMVVDKTGECKGVLGSRQDEGLFGTYADATAWLCRSKDSDYHVTRSDVQTAVWGVIQGCGLKKSVMPEYFGGAEPIQDGYWLLVDMRGAMY